LLGRPSPSSPRTPTTSPPRSNALALPSAGRAPGEERRTDSESGCGRKRTPRAHQLDEQAARERGNGERDVRQSVLSGEDTAANLVGRASLDERHGCDVPEPSAAAG